jgi:DNA-binding transcriptional LysR family regulator
LLPADNDLRSATSPVARLQARLSKLHIAGMSLGWDDLRHFLAFARVGSMQAAAKALGVNQSTVQRRIAELEGHIGRRLVERHLSGYRLTELGEELWPAAEDVEAAVAAFERRLAACDKGLTGTVRLTCGSSVADRLRRTPLIDAFHAQYPGLRVELVISDRHLDLSKGEADIAIRLGEPVDEALICRKIGNASWSVYASRGYVERHGRPDTPEGINDHLVVDCDVSMANYPGARWLRSVAPNAKIATRSDHWQGLILAVKAGAGLAALPHFQGDNESELIRVIDDIGLTMPFYLLMHRDMQQTPRMRAFVDFVASEIKSFRALVSGEGGVPDAHTTVAGNST